MNPPASWDSLSPWSKNHPESLYDLRAKAMHRSRMAPLMSALGHKRTSGQVCTLSAFTLNLDFRKVQSSDRIRQLSWLLVHVMSVSKICVRLDCDDDT